MRRPVVAAPRCGLQLLFCAPPRPRVAAPKSAQRRRSAAAKTPSEEEHEEVVVTPEEGVPPSRRDSSMDFGDSVSNKKRKSGSSAKEEDQKKKKKKKLSVSPPAAASPEDKENSPPRRKQRGATKKQTKKKSVGKQKEVVVDPFTKSYRDAMCGGPLDESIADLVRDERSFQAPWVLESIAASGVGRERCAVRCWGATKAPSAPEMRRRLGAYLGHGRYGAVFEFGEGRAVKLEKPAALLTWEAQMATRCSDDEAAVGCIVRPEALYLWQDAAALTMRREEATLAELCRVHAAGSATTRLPEPVALLYAISAIECLAKCHANDVLHCDLKPDNFLVRFGTKSSRKKKKMTIADAAASSGFGLVLIDFGRAIDLRRHPPTQRFAAKYGKRSHVEEYTWPDAHKGASWRYELDFYALGAMLHILVCGRAPATMSKPAIPRSWEHAELWREILDSLLIRKESSKSVLGDLSSRSREALDASCRDGGFATLLDLLLRHKRDLRAAAAGLLARD